MKEINDQLYELCFDMMIVPSHLCNKVQSLPATLNIQDKKANNPIEEKEEEHYQAVVPSEPLPPMSDPELKDVIHHSALCCHAVTYCPLSYSEFFLKQSHNFDAMSMSLTDECLERCLIATKEDSIYIAFRSEPDISNWIHPKDGYESFENGKLYTIVHVYTCISYRGFRRYDSAVSLSLVVKKVRVASYTIISKTVQRKEIIA